MKNLEKKSISELIESLEKANVEENDVDWEEIFEEIMKRVPYSTLDENIEEQKERISALEDAVEMLKKLIKNHHHIEAKVVIEIE